MLPRSHSPLLSGGRGEWGGGSTQCSAEAPAWAFLRCGQPNTPCPLWWARPGFLLLQSSLKDPLQDCRLAVVVSSGVWATCPCRPLALREPELVSTPLTPGPQPATRLCVGVSVMGSQLCRPTSLGSILGLAPGRPHVLHPHFQAKAPLGLSSDPKSQPCCPCSFKGGTGQDLTLTHAHHICELPNPACSLSAIHPRCQDCQCLPLTGDEQVGVAAPGSAVEGAS